jgi:hypothetical protein
MNINVKTLTGRTLNFLVTEEMTFDDLKVSISEREGIEKDQIRMIFGGNIVNLQEKIMESKMKPGNTLHLVLSLRGG